MRSAMVAVVCVIGSGMITGCSSNFVRPAPDAFTIGKSKPAEVEKQVTGVNPIRQNDVVINNEKINLTTYIGAPSFNGFYGSIIPRRTLTFSFFNDILIGEEFNSTVDEEKTEFDVKKIPQIHKGQTKDQVVAIMGKPSGNIRYPLVADKLGSGIVYAYTYSRYAPLVSPTWSHLFIVTLDQNNVVTNVSYKVDGKEQINL